MYHHSVLEGYLLYQDRGGDMAEGFWKWLEAHLPKA